ncbi:MAG: TRAP transporter small permease subunit [Clostridia bacterium]|nr:TRAP transporter small permease subunit [Clostridia bacterium]
MPAFFRTIEKIKPVYDWTYKILLFICKLLLIGDILITAWAVAGRYIPFITDPHWSEEIVLTMMAYMAVLSATLAIRKRAHIRMTAFDKYLPQKVLMASDLLADLAVMALGVVLVIYGVKFCNSPLSIRGKYASIPTLSKFWQYLPIPVAGASMIIFELEQAFQHIEAFFIKNDEKEAA